MKQLFAVTGQDGSGKSTLCPLLVQKLNTRYGNGCATELSIWDFLQFPQPRYESKQALLRAISSMSQKDRTRTILDLANDAFSAGFKRTESCFILNAYWYKYAASEMAYGSSFQLIQTLCQNLPTPQLTLFLDLPYETAATRKSTYSSYECGHIMHSEASHESDNALAFIAFQQKMQRGFLQLENEHGPWVHLSALLSPEELAHRAESEVARALATAGHHPQSPR